MAARPLVGLDIGTTGVRAAEIVPGRAGTVLQRFGQVALPSGAVVDGEVADPEAVAAALKQLWAQARFGSRNVVVGVANQRVVVRQVSLPWLPLPELRAALAFQVQDFIPMPVEHAVLDIHPLEEHVGENGQRMLRVLLVAAAREMIGRAMQAVRLAGLVPSMVDLTSFAVLRSVVTSEPSVLAVDAEALVDVGASITNIIVHTGGVPRFVRVLLMGGSDITDAVAERLGCPLQEAEAVKQTTGFVADPSAAPSPVTRAIESSGGAFVEEVRGSLDYYMAQPGAVRVGRVVLSGGGSRLRGLADRLALATRLPVDAARPLAGLVMGRTGLTPEQLAYVEPVVTVPVGLALGRAS